ncbi:MAG TPA: murein biosynthesis integral membrane protein MurJ [Candidatus Saccharimonadales bacterium]|jgi:putative peptidoglycan lipid II flippase|nr:murein biosynthesis integral membrane protein MurJ [Candidatus Saccharimonadales bacterium]
MNPTVPTSANKRSRLSIGNAAALLVATSLLGQVLGFLRTKLVNTNFPTTGPHSTDAYFAAFNVPDFFFFTLAAGALGVAFMPVLSDHLYKGDRRGVWELSNSLMNLLAIIMAVVGIIMLLFATPLIKYVVAPGLGPQQLHTAANIMRLLAFNPLLFTLSGVLTSVQQTMGRFFFYAVAPLFYNASIIASIFIFKHNIGLVGLGLGALIGAILQLLIVMLGLWKLGFHWRPKIKWHSPDFHTILRNLPPRSLDQGVDQVENLVETHIASGLGSGNITFYNNAFILSTAPILLVGTAISTAAFPRLNARLSQGRPDLFRKDFLMVLRAMIWISAPLVVVAFFCRGYLARLIFAKGSPQIAIIFGFLTVAIFFRIMYSIISRWFYAQKDTRTPLFVSLFTIALNVVLAVTLARPSAYGVAGLALAQSIVALIEVFILSSIMLYRDHRLFDAYFWGGVWRIMSVTGFSVLAAFIMITLYPLGINDKGIITLGSKLLFIAAVTFGVHIAISALFDLEEVRPIFDRVRRIVFKPVKVEL